MLERLTLTVAHSKMLEDERAIPCEIAAEMGVVSRGPHMAFEFRKNGVCQYRQIKRRVRNDDGTMGKTFHIEPSGAALFFWNDDCLNEELPAADTPLIITEGVEDALSWLAAGAQFVVSVPNGTPETPGEGDIIPTEDQRFAYLWVDGQLDPRLNRFRRIVLSTDNDKPGRVLRDELAIRLGRPRCWYLDYPPGCKDANDVLRLDRAKGVDMLIDMLDAARPIVPSRLVSFDEIPETRRMSYSSGWRDLDPNLMIVRPELMVITGPPGHGKSQFALNVAANLADGFGWRGSIIQFEDDVERNRNDLRRYWLAKHKGDGPHSDDDAQEATAWMRRHFRTISPSEEIDDTIFDLQWLRSLIEEAVVRHGHRWILIDPWNEIDHAFAKGQTEAQYLNDALRGLKRLARRYQILLMIVAHPDKEGGREMSIERWSLYNMAGGAVWNNKADHGVVLLRPNDDPITYIKIAKSKSHALMGKPGIARLRFRPRSSSFEFVGAGL